MRSLYLNVTDMCDMRCVFCYANSGTYNNTNNSHRFIDKEIAITAINKFHGSINGAPLRIIFFGGEPLLGISLIQEIVKHFNQNADCNFSYGIVTNGLKLDNVAIEFFKKEKFLITISFEGDELSQKNRPTSEIANSYSHILKNISLLEQENIKYNIRFTMTHECVNFENRLRELKKLGNPRIRGMFASPIGLENIDVQPSDLDIYEREVLSICMQQPELLENYEPIQKIKRKIINETSESHVNCCLMGMNGFAIDVYGKIYPCYRLVGIDKFQLGDVHEETAFSNHWVIPAIEFHQSNPCKDCSSNKYCGNLCYVEMNETSGCWNIPWPIRCREQEINIKAANMLIGLNNECIV